MNTKKSWSILSVFALALLALAGGATIFQTRVLAQQPVICAALGPPAYYECLDSNDPDGPIYNFQDIAGNNPALVFGDNDDGVVHITMPFTFTFYNLASNKLTVSMNGAMKEVWQPY